MAYTSDRPISVDGERLDTLAWNIEKVNRSTAQRRSNDVYLPNLDGALPSMNDALEPVDFGLQMWLRGTDADGGVPAAGSRDTFRANLDHLLHLFGKRHGLLEVVEQTGPGTETVQWIPNPTLATLTGWSLGNATGSVVDGAAVVTAGGAVSTPYIITPQTTIPTPHASVWVTVRAERAASSQVNGTARAEVRWYRADGILLRTDVIMDALQGDGMKDVTVALTRPPLAERFVAIVFFRNGFSAGDVFRVDSFSIATSEGLIFDGNTPADTLHTYAWDGTALASPSRRIPRNRRRALAKVTGAIAPDVNTTGTAGVFSVALSVPAGMWEDADSTDVTLNAPVSAAEPAGLIGGTERINDAIYLVTGPANTPRITDPTTGMWVELGANLPAGQFWRFNSATWSSRYGAGLTLGSADTAGTDGSGVTAAGGPSRAYGLPLVPVMSSGSRRCRVTLTAASGIVNGTTKLSIRARRKYAA